MRRSILLLVGTKKGLFILRSDARRVDWEVEGPRLAGWEISTLAADLRQRPLFLAGVTSRVYGPHLQLSRDLGRTWQPIEGSPSLPRAPQIPPHPHEGAEPHPGAVAPRLRSFWMLRPGLEDGVVWAGAADAALFRSGDGGLSWELVSGLYDHPTRAEWEPDRGGLSVHSLVEDPWRPRRLYVGLSAVGVLRTDDGGESWEVCNRGIQAARPGWTRCVHALVRERGDPQTLYQQSHYGVYRSGDGGVSWERIERGLPSGYGFPLVAHPQRPGTLFVVPLASDEHRMPPSGVLRVYRSTDGGASWHLPGEPVAEACYQAVLRQGLAADGLEPLGLYVGTEGGLIYASRDDGATWRELPGRYPRVLSLRAVVCAG